MYGWMSGWVGGRAGLRVAYSNQKGRGRLAQSGERRLTNSVILSQGIISQGILSQVISLSHHVTSSTHACL